MTGSQLGWNNFLKNFKSHTLHTIPNEKVYRLIKPTLHGGKVEVLHKYARIENDRELITGLVLVSLVSLVSLVPVVFFVSFVPLVCPVSLVKPTWMGLGKKSFRYPDEKFQLGN